ncbi:MAG: protease complex subunit PrcB family protein [Flavobacteriales bacterium]|nr:protease complex subunit PrcB family protein [Flavobacteriales bacterium]
MRFLLVIISFLFFACSSSQETVAEKTVTYNSVYASQDSGFETPQTKTITNQNEFKEIWTQAMSRFHDKPEIPAIDFEKNQVLLIALGVKNNGGYKLQMDKVVENKNSIVVNYFENKPGANCMTTQAIVFPFELIEIPKNSKKVEFVKTVKIVDCK